jgi:hypothetical protein
MTDLLVRLQRALPHVREWIDDLHAQHADQAIPAGSLGFPRLASCFPEGFLQNARAVTVGHIPFPPVSAYGLPEFESMANMDMVGITFRNMDSSARLGPLQALSFASPRARAAGLDRASIEPLLGSYVMVAVLCGHILATLR